MANNLAVAYDLFDATPERYAAIRKTIETCATRGFSWLQFSLCYIKTDMSINGVHDRVRAVMKPLDKLAVIAAADIVLSPVKAEPLDKLAVIAAADIVLSPVKAETLATLQREFQSA
jgi:hypothetical protein